MRKQTQAVSFLRNKKKKEQIKNELT
jgi:hypothetical protein